MAAALSAVLRAAAEQISREKLVTFHVSSPFDLDLLGLAMAFRPDDSGILGDTFEWAVLAAINHGDPTVNELVTDAFTLMKEPLPSSLQAVLAAVEHSRAAYYLPTLPDDAVLRTGRPGRPPRLQPLLGRVNIADWKSDVVIGGEAHWIGATVKSNPSVMAKHLTRAVETRYPPRLGITAVPAQHAGVQRDPDTGILVVRVPVDGVLMALLGSTIRDVKQAFQTHLALPSSPLDVRPVARQLGEWRHEKVSAVIDALDERAAEMGAELFVSSPAPTETTLIEHPDALLAVNPVSEVRHHERIAPQPGEALAFRIGRFDAF